MRNAYKLGKHAPDEDVQDMVARAEARRVRIDDISEVAIGFRPPGQWERLQVAFNFQLWHTPIAVRGARFAILG